MLKVFHCQRKIVVIPLYGTHEVKTIFFFKIFPLQHAMHCMELNIVFGDGFITINLKDTYFHKVPLFCLPRQYTSSGFFPFNYHSPHVCMKILNPNWHRHKKWALRQTPPQLGLSPLTEPRSCLYSPRCAEQGSMSPTLGEFQVCLEAEVSCRAYQRDWTFCQWWR